MNQVQALLHEIQFLGQRIKEFEITSQLPASEVAFVVVGAWTEHFTLHDLANAVEAMQAAR